MFWLRLLQHSDHMLHMSFFSFTHNLNIFTLQEPLFPSSLDLIVKWLNSLEASLLSNVLRILVTLSLTRGRYTFWERLSCNRVISHPESCLYWHEMTWKCVMFSAVFFRIPVGNETSYATIYSGSRVQFQYLSCRLSRVGLRRSQKVEVLCIHSVLQFHRSGSLVL